MRVPALRLLTALAVVAVCGLVVFRGWDIVRFSNAEAALAATPDRSKLRAWSAIPGLSFSAQVAALDPEEPDDRTIALARRDELAILLSTRPLSPGYWLSLARARLATGRDSAKVLDGMAFSALIGANESYAMSRRGLLGLALWDDAPPEVKRRTAIDLAESLKTLSATNVSSARRIIVAKDDKVRDEIRSWLAEQGAPADRMTRIGL